MGSILIVVFIVLILVFLIFFIIGNGGKNNKDITTSLPIKLCFTLQRYKIESNSQPVATLLQRLQSCVSHCKDTKLKAIHNILILSF